MTKRQLENALRAPPLSISLPGGERGRKRDVTQAPVLSIDDLTVALARSLGVLQRPGVTRLTLEHTRIFALEANARRARSARTGLDPSGLRLWRAPCPEAERFRSMKPSPR